MNTNYKVHVLDGAVINEEEYAIYLGSNANLPVCADRNKQKIRSANQYLEKTWNVLGKHEVLHQDKAKHIPGGDKRHVAVWTGQATLDRSEQKQNHGLSAQRP